MELTRKKYKNKPGELSKKARKKLRRVVIIQENYFYIVLIVQYHE